MRLETKFGNKPQNQEIRYTDKGMLFVSYDTKIVLIPHEGKIQLDSQYWDYSATTGYYRNQVLGEGIAETRKKIESGKYELVNLN